MSWNSFLNKLLFVINRCINEFDGDRNAMWKDFLGLRKSIDKAKSTLVCELSVTPVFCEGKTHR